MEALLALFAEAGPARWALAIGAAAASVLALFAALALIASWAGASVASRWAWRLAFCATAAGALTAFGGGAALVAARVQTDASVAGLSRPVERQRARRDGYLAARPVARLGLEAAALPLTLAVLVLLVSARRVSRGGPSVVVTLGAMLACGTALAALHDPVPGRNRRADATTRRMLDLLEDVRSASKADELDRLRVPCNELEEEMDARRETLDAATISGLSSGARTCVEARIQVAAIQSDIQRVMYDVSRLGRSPLVEHDPELVALVAKTVVEVSEIASVTRELPRVHPGRLD